jgi:hypothetical protein
MIRIRDELLQRMCKLEKVPNSHPPARIPILPHIKHPSTEANAFQKSTPHVIFPVREPSKVQYETPKSKVLYHPNVAVPTTHALLHLCISEVLSELHTLRSRVQLLTLQNRPQQQMHSTHHIFPGIVRQEIHIQSATPFHKYVCSSKAQCHLPPPTDGTHFEFVCIDSNFSESSFPGYVVDGKCVIFSADNHTWIKTQHS